MTSEVYFEFILVMISWGSLVGLLLAMLKWAIRW